MKKITIADIKSVRLEENTSRDSFQLDGFTVKPGMFFGTVTLRDGRTYSAVWSGWTSEGAIALYIISGFTSKPFWVGEYDCEYLEVRTSRNFLDESWDEFCAENGREPDAYEWSDSRFQIPFFAQDADGALHVKSGYIYDVT